MSWQSVYRTIANKFGVKGPFYGPQGHRGADYFIGAHEPVPSYFTGTCVFNGHSSVLGNYTVFKVKTGDYRGFAHLLVGTRRDIGDKVKPGDTVGKAAGRGDDHGSAWSGPHIHTTRSPVQGGIVSGTVTNPSPGIAAAIRSVTSPPPKPTAKTVTVTVKSGDNLTKIANANKTTVPKILALPQTPKITDPDRIKIGQKIRVK